MIDEFEKADESIFNFFYELLEDGRYTDLDENEIDLNGFIIIFTSNLTRSNYAEKIPEPLLSRFDMKYEFEPLTSEEYLSFAESLLDQLISDYDTAFNTTIDGTIKRDIMKTLLIDHSNLRELKRSITQQFIETIQTSLQA